MTSGGRTSPGRGRGTAKEARSTAAQRRREAAEGKQLLTQALKLRDSADGKNKNADVKSVQGSSKQRDAEHSRCKAAAREGSQRKGRKGKQETDPHGEGKKRSEEEAEREARIAEN